MTQCLKTKMMFRLFVLVSVSGLFMSTTSAMDPARGGDIQSTGVSQQADTRNVSRTPYGQGIEAQRMHAEIGDYNYRTSEVYLLLRERFGVGVTVESLKRLYKEVSENLRVHAGVNIGKLSRMEKRSKQLIIRKMDQNKQFFIPVISNMRVVVR